MSTSAPRERLPTDEEEERPHDNNTTKKPPKKPTRRSTNTNTLLKMITAASAGKHGCTWSHVLQYMKAHTVVDERFDRYIPTTYESPIANTRCASANLIQDLQDPNTILSAISHGAPQRILAAIIHLDPERLTRPDENGRLPLHLACRYPPNDAVFTHIRLLIQAYPQALVHCDTQGRTALHYVLWYHAETRTVETIQLFLQTVTMNKKITSIPDAIHGCLPIHYAACFRARESILQLLIAHAPSSKHAVDQGGRTPLHWYLRWDGTNAAGEPNDTAVAVQWNVNIVRLLSTSRVARTVDQEHEHTPLHTACQSIAMMMSHDDDDDDDDTIPCQVIQTLLDTHAGQLVMQDRQGRTPVMVYLNTLLERQCNNNNDNTPIHRRVVQLLQKNPNVAGMESKDGKLPLHLALAIASPTEMVQSWLDLHPTGLLHVDEHMRVALHEAFRYNAAKLQTKETIDMLLQKSCETNGVNVDGRLAMKMEDVDGNYAIHLACMNGASAEVIQTIIARYPKAALLLNPNDDLPVQCLLNKAAFRDPTSIREKVKAMLPPLLAAPHALRTQDSRYGMMPLHIMVYFQAANYAELLKLLEECPEAAEHFAKAILGEDGPQTASPLDLHEMNRREDNLTEWHLIRELLFSFSPKLESHRHRQELLDRCVGIIVDDITGNGSSHLRNDDRAICSLELTHTVSAMEAQVNTKKFLRTQTYLAKRQLTGQGSNGSGGPLHSAPTRRKGRAPTLPQLSFSSSEDANAKGSRSLNSRTTTSRNSIYDDESTGLDGYDTQSHIDDDDDESSYGSGETSFSGTEEDPTETEGATTTLDGDTEGEFTTEGGTYSSEEEFGTETISHSISNTHSTSDQDTFLDDIGFFARKAETLDMSGRGSIDMLQKKSTESSVPSVLKTPRRGNQVKRRAFSRPSFMSEVGMRLWTFFMLYRDPKNPGDNYSRQIGEIVDSIDLAMVELLVTHPIPPYASAYLDIDDYGNVLSYRDAACPKCREIVQKTCFFLGLYDFRCDGDVLVHRGWNGQCIAVKAFEWIFTTEEETDAKSPGVAEQSIWSSGEVPPEIGLTYRTSKKPVLVRFLTSRHQYEAEIAREQLPADGTGSFLSIRGHFDAFGVERKADMTYASQIQDPQFNKVKIGTFDSETIELDAYPYAVVYDWPVQGTLVDYSRRHGMEDPQRIRRLAADLANGLLSLHGAGICGIGVTDRNIVMLDETDSQWGFMSLALASKSGSFAGGIDDRGLARFSMDSLPPCMFEEVSPKQLVQYENYWKAIRERFHVSVDDRITKPLIDDTTGASWVVKCHFIPLTESGEEVSLPYELQTTTTHHDVWSFGKLLLELLSGRRVQRREDRFGILTGHSDIVFNAEPLVLELISDSVAQDLLLKCLSSPPGKFSVADLLKHPYISGCQSPKIAETLSFKTASFSRDIAKKHKASAQQKSKEQSGGIVDCWDLAMLEKFFMSPSSLLVDRFETVCPCSVVLLPDTVESSHCERLGVSILSLIKSCYFASVMQQALGEKTKTKGSVAREWPAATAMRVLDLTNKDFAGIQQRMEDFATRHVEAYRSDPLSIAVRIARDRLADVVSLYKELHVGFVDEYTGRRSGPTVEVPVKEMQALLMSAIPLFVLTCVYSMGLSNDLSSMGHLLRCYPVPLSWNTAASGLPFELSDTVMMNTMQALDEYLGGVDFHAWERFCLDRDPFLRRMESTSGGSLWTAEALKAGGSMKDILHEFQRLKSGASPTRTLNI